MEMNWLAIFFRPAFPIVFYGAIGGTILLYSIPRMVHMLQ